jgi:hypothetical protein
VVCIEQLYYGSFYRVKPARGTPRPFVEAVKTSIEHISINVTDVEFYKELLTRLGFKVIVSYKYGFWATDGRASIWVSKVQAKYKKYPFRPSVTSLEGKAFQTVTNASFLKDGGHLGGLRVHLDVDSYFNPCAIVGSNCFLCPLAKRLPRIILEREVTKLTHSLSESGAQCSLVK